MSYKFATDSEVGTIEAASFAEACEKLDAMVGNVDGAWGWVEDVDGDRYEAIATQYRFENGKLYKLDGDAYVHCYSSIYATTEDEAIRLYEQSQN